MPTSEAFGGFAVSFSGSTTLSGSCVVFDVPPTVAVTLTL
jgi:hypothetical protein